MNVSSRSSSPIEYSFIIPTYNRREAAEAAIASALTFISDDDRYEVILIDDASTDGTFHYIQSKFISAIQDGYLRILRLEHNVGVVGARNYGAQASRGRWLLMLDSDNEIISDHKADFEAAVSVAKHPFILFRCVDDYGALIGPRHVGDVLDYYSALNLNFPEFFGVCSRDIFLDEYTSDDVVSLRRFEAIAYFRVLKRYGHFNIFNFVMRRYSFMSNDRLSSKFGAVKDAGFLIRGHFLFLRENWRYMSIRRLTLSLGTICYYCLLVIKSKIFPV